MNEINFLEQMNLQTQLTSVLDTNQYTSQFGLVLSEDDARLLLAERQNTLKEQKRIEFGATILPRLIYEFCDSAYIRQEDYAETLIQLQDIFFLYKNEMLDEITDDELLHFMKEQFETVCYGDLDYLSGTCLELFAQAIRAGYQGYQFTDGYGAYRQFDKVPRWDRELYLETLNELCGR